jgi:hypothetical protein
VRRSGIAPYRQDQLDGLCGLYAIINAIRLATHDRTGEFGHGVWRELLLALISEAESVVGTATAVVTASAQSRCTSLLKPLSAIWRANMVWRLPSAARAGRSTHLTA